jgi:hypothetical protein
VLSRDLAEAGLSDHQLHEVAEENVNVIVKNAESHYEPFEEKKSENDSDALCGEDCHNTDATTKGLQEISYYVQNDSYHTGIYQY